MSNKEIIQKLIKIAENQQKIIQKIAQIAPGFEKVPEWDELSEKEQIFSNFSDAYKEMHGIRPRFININEISLEDMRKKYDDLMEEYHIDNINDFDYSDKNQDPIGEDPRLDPSEEKEFNQEEDRYQLSQKHDPFDK